MDAKLDKAPLQGKTVLLVHPAWHSCGSHQVFVSQADAYRSLGARVLDLALAATLGSVEGSPAHEAYAAATSDLQADTRFFAGVPWSRILWPSFRDTGWLWLHGNLAAMAVVYTRLTPLPKSLLKEPKIDFIHCNHFFCMPAAAALRQRYGAPIVLDTHDIQAHQYLLRNQATWAIPPRTKFEKMLKIEVRELAKADVLIHLNNEEAATFKSYLPSLRHELVYPTVPPIAPGNAGEDFIIVASANYPNFLGVSWFLEEILPRVPNIPIKIIGNIDNELRTRAPELLNRYESLFTGRVQDLDAAYANAAAVLLPTTEGHGISIKTIEALSSGAPLIATRHAFRGMPVDPSHLQNVALASDAESFAALLTQAAHCKPHIDRLNCATRSVYKSYFSFETYRAELDRISHSLIGTGLKT
ncbi:glycosyltransferase [Beijerinckia indica]|uniref:Glycosyl transferase group 1 n=1 Tax=Beijerinckia indica subsp. indica (strain ATCC 9039 / DSM 1715 / NCIMB 8712) TaxID=395963 RepID=B2IFN1_BEII9|nr:glycosyltransferase [Beijerinckia indica]ACB94242.1 glycosyl transferase group 1 [Beijerinckia indica subsp. indica ATCC 9039]